MRDETLCASTPSVKIDGFASLMIPVSRASTIVFPDAGSYATRHQRGDEGYSYGLNGTPTTRALEHKITLLHGGARTLLVPSGQAGVSLSLLACASAGEKVLICDSVYPPARDFAVRELSRLGVEVEFYDSCSLEDLERRLDRRTRLVWVESPGSTTMEIQDLPAIVSLARRYGALVGCDNTWATPLNFKPLSVGSDIVVEALTKYFSGHSDLLMGSITFADADRARKARSMLSRFGIGVSPDDCSLVLRGMETMAVRVSHSARIAAHLAERMARSGAVQAVLFPPRLGSPGHEIWKRDFRGASGVFSVVFVDGLCDRIGAALDSLRTFSIGASWGGTRSLVAPMNVKPYRSVRPWTGDDMVLRLSVGVEAVEDLEADIDRLLAVMERGA